MRQLTPWEAKQLLDSNTGYVFIWMCGPFRSLTLGHVPGAKNVPLMEPDPYGRMQMNPRFVEIVQANFGKCSFSPKFPL